MDKVKDIGFLVFKKHLFWTLGSVVLMMGLVAWWLSAGKLAEEYKANKSTVEGTKQKIVTVSQKPTEEIFNQGTEDGMTAENTRRAKEVYLAWREKYIRQRRDVLVWPDGLSPAFIRDVERILDGRPIEEVTLNSDNDLIRTRREEFRDQINVLLPQLAEMINSQWDPSAATSNVRGGRGGPTRGNFSRTEGGRATSSSGSGDEGEEEPLAVNWDTADQGQKVQQHFNFYEDDRPAPSTIQILYAMEDYWVLKALMQIVARTNTNNGVLSHRRDLSAIRDILSIQIGAAVDQGAGGQVYRPVSTDVEGEAGIESSVRGSEGGVQGGNVAGVEGEGVQFGEGASQVKELAEGRYVDKEFKKLPAATLKTAATGKNEEDAYLAVAKRMPVRMRVKMDQRKLNKFLVECGNGDLMLEVVQVRINPDDTDVISLAGSSSGSGGFGRVGPSRAGRGPGAGATSNTGSPDGKAEPWDVVVEVYGIIYIFNPPSIERLGLSEEDKQKLDAVDLDDTAAAQAAAAEPSEGTPATGTDDADPEDEDADPAADEPAAPADGEPADAAPADGAPPDPAEEDAAAQANPPDNVPAG